MDNQQLLTIGQVISDLRADGLNNVTIIRDLNSFMDSFYAGSNALLSDYAVTVHSPTGNWMGKGFNLFEASEYNLVKKTPTDDNKQEILYGGVIDIHEMAMLKSQADVRVSLSSNSKLVGLPSMKSKHAFSFSGTNKKIRSSSDQKEAMIYCEDEEIAGIIFTELSGIIPPSVFRLKSLRMLACCYSNLTEVSNELSQLKSLEFLNLSNNLISVFNDSIFQLPNLRYLDLGDNHLASMSLNVRYCEKLTALVLSNNKLTTLPEEILELNELWSCTELRYDIHENKRKAVTDQKFEIAAELRDQESKLIANGRSGIIIAGNDIENLPPELAYKGRKKIKDYWNSLKNNDSLPVNEFKLIFVGEGGSGKTSLLKRITNEEFDPNEKQTHGINIKTWLFNHEEKSIVANLWDFGGQEIMHSTHQFFLSHRSLYIVVVDSRKEEKIEYWLKHIEALGSNSPTLIVINKIDENPGFDINRKFLVQKYPNILAVIRVSCNIGEGLDSLRDAINASIPMVTHIHTLWPKSWFELKQKLQTVTHNFISLEEFKEYCKESDIYLKESQNTLLDFLHDLGVMLHFKDFSLKDTNVLNPHWVTEGVYKIINSQQLAEHVGILSFQLLEDILPLENYPVEQHNFIVSLMEKFELCYKVNSNEMLIPDLLSVQEPELDFESDLRFVMQYSFLPRSIFPRLIVRMKKDIDNNLAWRTGALLRSEQYQTKAKILVDYEERKIVVEVSGKRARDYFTVLRYTLTDINESFSNLSISERIPIGPGEATVSYNHLLHLEQLGIFSYIPEGLLFPIDVSETLGTFTKSRKETIEEEILQELKEINSKVSDRQGLVNEANRILELKPNIAGIGININALIDRFFNKD